MFCRRGGCREESHPPAPREGSSSAVPSGAVRPLHQLLPRVGVTGARGALGTVDGAKGLLQHVGKHRTPTGVTGWGPGAMTGCGAVGPGGTGTGRLPVVGSESVHVLCKLRFLLIFQLVSVPGGVWPWDGVGGVSSAASQTGGMRKGLGLGPGRVWGCQGCAGEGGCAWTERGVSRALGGQLPSPNIPWSRLHGFGLGLVAFRPLECHPRFKGVLANPGQAVPSHCGVSLASVDAAAGEHASFKPLFRHLR